MRPAARRGAASLVEIAVTVAVMAVGILGIYRLLSASHREMAAGREYVSAAALAAEMADRVRLVPYDRLVPTDGFVPAERAGWLDGLLPTAPHDAVERFASVAQGEGHKIVECEVRWETRGKEVRGGKATSRFFVLRTPHY